MDKNEVVECDYSRLPESFDPDFVPGIFWHGREEQVEEEEEEEERGPPNSPASEPDNSVEEAEKETEKEVEGVKTDVVTDDGGEEKEAEPEVEEITIVFQPQRFEDDDENKENIPPNSQMMSDDDEDKENIPPKSQDLEVVPETPDASNRSPTVYMCIPSTPKPRRLRSRFNCDCVVLNTEYKRNRVDLADGIEKEEKVDLQKKRLRLCEPQRMLCTEFQISKGIIVRLVVLSDCLLPPGKRVVLTITSETNEICVVASTFLKGINALNREFVNFNDDVEEEHEIELCEGTVFAEIEKDAEGLWMVFRQYIDEWVSERIYMSPKTWFEFRALCPLLSNCLDVYLSKLVQQDPLVARSFLFQ